MDQLTTSQLLGLLAGHGPPCVSLYQPTHRHSPDNQQDPIRYRNLLRELNTSLAQKYPQREVRPLLERFRSLARDEHFWTHRTEGLAVLGAAGEFHVFELQRAVPERLVVADSFHLKPLLRITQSADRYQVLCLGRHEARLYEGNRDALDPVELTGVPATITEALGEELTEPHTTVASYAGTGGPHSGHGEPAMRHGHGGRKDEIDIDLERFFRVIDRGILEHYSRPSGLPLMLAALPEYHTPFRKLSNNPQLMAEGITANPDALTVEQLRAESWTRFEPRYRERLAWLVAEFKAARSRGLGSEHVADVAVAAAGGRVAVLLVEADRLIPGRIRPLHGGFEAGDLADPEMDDVLDDLAELVLRMKGQVVVVPAAEMPVTTGIAATFRY